MNKYKILITLVVILIMAGAVYATGSLTPPAGTPVPTSYTMSDVYNKLVNGTVAGSHTLTTTGAVAPTFRTLSEIYNAIPNALSISPSSTAVPVGINRTATALNNIDTDLIADNIRSGVNIFGIAGTYTGSGGGTVPLSWSNAFYNPSATTGYTRTLCWTSNPAVGCNTVGRGIYNHQGILMGAKEYCAYLNQAGTALTTTANNYWRLPTKAELYDELSRLLVISPDPTTLHARFPNSVGGATFAYWSSDVSSSTIVASIVYPRAWGVGSTVQVSVDNIQSSYQLTPMPLVCVKP